MRRILPAALPAIVMAMSGCRPSDILSVPAPAGVVANSALHSQSGAESAFDAAKSQFFNAADGGLNNPGVLAWTGLLTDEFSMVVDAEPDVTPMDARQTSVGSQFTAWTNLQTAHTALVLAAGLLSTYEPASARSNVGEAYALMGYDEIVIAESFCAGTPLDQILSQGGIQYSAPVTTDSMFALAAGHFTTASGQTGGSDSVSSLASVGLGRALLDRGQYAAAAAAVHNVPTSFVYNVELQPTESGNPNEMNIYAFGYANVAYVAFNVSDREGGNGLPFRSAHDPRLQFDSSLQDANGTPWYVPLKFEANFAYVPLATGIEARLIEAEAALQQGQTSTWLADLNALRNSGCTISGTDTTCALGTGRVPGQAVGLPSLSDPGTDSGRVSVMFRERAFWLFGTGTRLGDLRRLIREYGRDQNVVFPAGPYAQGQNPQLPAPIPTYGTDVTLRIPTAAQMTITNPYYKGCTSPPSTA
jgi:hypothetical protein